MPDTNAVVKKEKTSDLKWSLEDFYKEDEALSAEVDRIFDDMSQAQRAAQMIMPAAGRLGEADSVILRYVKNDLIGGVLLLNGSTSYFPELITKLDSANDNLALLYSADAEPSLINRKIKGTPEVAKTADITSLEQCGIISDTIANTLKRIGIRYNFAPVCDLSTSNAAIGNRSFGTNVDTVAAYSDVFIAHQQQHGIAATAKHFPGHGLVKGDSHRKMVYIEGEMKELPVYPKLISAGVISVMVGHIAVDNNKYATSGVPASLSSTIVKDLLVDSLGFKGIIVTDALNMGAVSTLKDASWRAATAGNDIALMPLDVERLHAKIQNALTEGGEMSAQFEKSIKKVIRLKLCLGIQ